MDLSGQEAFDVVSCGLLALMLWGACAGIGARLLPRGPATPAESEPVSWRQPGVAACVGLGTLLALGGVGVAFEIPWWLLVVPFLAVGLVLVMRDLRRVERHGVSKALVATAVIGVAAFVVVAVIEALPGLRFALNACDDWRAYLPMAKRLIATNGLAEPWSSRRLQNLGGYTFLQALPVSVFGDAGIGTADTVIASVFLAGLFIGTGLRAAWARWLSVALILVVPLLFVPRINTTGVLLGSPFLVAALAATAEMRAALRRCDRRAAVRWAIADGFVIAALGSVRPDLLAMAAAVLVLGAVVLTGPAVRERIVVVLAGGAASVIAISPWSYAAWRTVRTPFYPVFTGNLNPATQESSTVTTVGNMLYRAFHLAATGPYLWAVLGVMVVAVLARNVVPDAALVVIGAAVAGALTVLFALLTPDAPAQAFIRYTAPMSEGLAVFFVCETIRAADARRQAPSQGIGRTAPLIAITAAVCLATLSYSVVGLEGFTILSGANLVVRAARDDLQPLPRQRVAPTDLQREYNRALLTTNPDRTIAAVDRPSLIDYDRFDVPSLDAPGYVAPGGYFPFFTGPRPKVATLLRGGFDTLVVTIPRRDHCLDPLVILPRIQHDPTAQARYRRVLDWDYDIEAIAKLAPASVRAFGELYVIDLRVASRLLPHSARDTAAAIRTPTPRPTARSARRRVAGARAR